MKRKKPSPLPEEPLGTPEEILDKIIADETEFFRIMRELREQLRGYSAESKELEKNIDENLEQILGMEEKQLRLF